MATLRRRSKSHASKTSPWPPSSRRRRISYFSKKSRRVETSASGAGLWECGSEAEDSADGEALSASEKRHFAQTVNGCAGSTNPPQASQIFMSSLSFSRRILGRDAFHRVRFISPEHWGRGGTRPYQTLVPTPPA